MKDKIYIGTNLKEEISISALVTVHYFEFAKDYSFDGESHDFWELVYVDNGSVTVSSEAAKHRLNKGELIFHAPNEWHSLKADGVSAASAIIVSFLSFSEALKGLCDRIFKLGNTERTLLSDIIKEARGAFDSPLSDLVTPKLNRKTDQIFGSEQMIQLNLCKLIITLLREKRSTASVSTKRNLDEGLFGEITEFLANSVGKRMTLEDIARHAGISKTALKQLFKEKADCGAWEYFIKMKIDCAKTYIREKNYNFTQIAEMLGYNSVHYFSAQFKKWVNMTPSEYAGSIKALSGEAENFNRQRL